MKKTILLALSILSLVILISSIPIEPWREAKAFQVTSYPTRTTVNQLVPSTVHGKAVFVSVEDKTWIRVVDANSSTTLALFNMTNALMNGFNINYAVTNISCNPTLSECVVGYDTQGTGTCAFSPNLCSERIVLVDIANDIWSPLSKGRNYTQTSNTLQNVAFSYGTPQFTVIATLAPTGGGNSFFQFEGYNDSDAVNAHPFVFCCTLSTGAASTFNGAEALGTFTIGGVCCNNYIGLAQTSGTSFQSINIGARSLGCTVATGSQVNDIKYTSDSIGQFWWTIQGTSIKKISQSGLGACSVITTTDLTAVTGGNNLKSIAIDSTLGYVFVESNSKFFVINETSLSATPIAIYGVPSDTVSFNGIAPYPNGNNGGVAVSSSSQKITVFYWNSIGSINGVASGNQVCVNSAQVGSGGVNLVCFGVCDSSGIANFGCNPNGTLKPSSGISANALIGANNVTSSFANIFCEAGLQFTCNSYNSKTNGIGYLVILGLLVLFVALLATVSKDDSGRINLSEIHPAIWIAGIIGVTGAPYLMGISDGIPFFGSIVGVSAFGALRIVRGFT